MRQGDVFVDFIRFSWYFQSLMPTGAFIIVRGFVQGVGYRYFVSSQARTMGLRGYVRNQYDGSVEVDVSGERASIETLIELLRTGPRNAEVTEVVVEWKEHPDQYTHFEIR
jgi:acylphosphatase